MRATINQERFALAPQTVTLLRNTVDWLHAQDVWHKAHES